MTISAVCAFAASLCFVLATVWAGAADLTTMKIRNELVLLLFAAYFALAPLSGFGAAEIGLNAAAATGVLAGTYVLFAMGWIGGGDAKLMAVVVLWLGVDQALPYVFYMAIFGGVLTLILLQFRSLPLPAPWTRVSWITKLHSPASGVPYGIAISSAALYVFPSTTWMTALL